jgi:hypothetical protein
MQKLISTRAPANVQLRRLVTKVITPVVLLAGVLLLAVWHFRGVLAITQAQDDLFRGVTSYDVGSLQTTFQHHAGTDRPNISYSGVNLLTYVDWSSVISIDGHAQNLWDNFHGYSADGAHRQVFATTSGQGWQVIAVITAVDARTITVHYDFVARNIQLAAPHDVTLTIMHVHKAWYQPTIHGNTFTAQVLPRYASPDVPSGSVSAIGTLRLAVSGPAVPTNALALTDLRSTAGSDGSLRSLATALTSTYTLSNPKVDTLTPLGTETITFASNGAPGAPLPSSQQSGQSTPAP